MWDGVRKAFHILIHDFFSLFFLAVNSPPGRLLEKKELGLVSVSPSVSVALVSTLTCHSGVSPLLSLSRRSPHLPQRQSTAPSSVSVTVRVVIPTATLNENIVNGYRRHSQNSCSYYYYYFLSPSTGVEPESSGEHVSPVTDYDDFLSGFAVRIECNVRHVLFSASTRPTGQLEGRGAEVTDLASLRLVD